MSKRPPLTPEEIAELVPSGWLIGEGVTPLYEHLAGFVPLEILEWKKQDGPDEWHFEEVRRRMEKLRGTEEDSAATIYPGYKKCQTATAIGTLVECLGVMAFLPGGVKFGPLHFWANREEDEKQLSSEKEET